MARYRISIIFILLLGSVGCTYNYRPYSLPMKPGMVPDFTASKVVVAIVNAQTSDELIKLRSYWGSSVVANLKEWTGIAVDLLRTELSKRGISVAEDAKKELKLTITQAKSFRKTYTYTTLTLKVELGNGYIAKFQGENYSQSPLLHDAMGRSSGGAITRAVAAMLNDRKIISYLKEEKGQ